MWTMPLVAICACASNALDLFCIRSLDNIEDERYEVSRAVRRESPASTNLLLFRLGSTAEEELDLNLTLIRISETSGCFR